MAKSLYQARMDYQGDGEYIALTHGSEEVWIPFQSIRIAVLESSQDHQDPMGDLMDLESVRLEYEGIEYDLGPYAALDNDVSEVLLEWYSPT
jgi:hypothetical protein